MKIFPLILVALILTSCSSKPENTEVEDIKIVDEEQEVVSEKDVFVEQKKAELDSTRNNHARDMYFLQKELEAKVASGEIEQETMRKALWDAEIAFRNGMTEKLEDAKKVVEEMDPATTTSETNQEATTTEQQLEITP